MIKDNRAVTSQVPESSPSEETGATAVSTVTDTDKSGYTWRIDLATTESHWKGWFQGSLPLFSRPQSSHSSRYRPVRQGANLRTDTREVSVQCITQVWSPGA